MKILKEKWFMYQQIECKDGFVDVYVGDIADNPNYDKPSKWNLNAIRMWFRIDNGEWFVNDKTIDEIKQMTKQEILDNC